MTRTFSDIANGPAFATGDHKHGGQAGMSYREWLAGQLLAHFVREFQPDMAAIQALSYADALIAKLAPENNDPV